MSVTTHQVQAHNSPEHALQGNPSQDIIVNQLTVGISSKLRHGPVRTGETLSSIAKQRAPENMSRDHFMNLVFDLNPQAFINQDKNRLKVNSLLILPGYNDTLNTNTAYPRTQFNEKKIELTEYGPLLQIKDKSASALFLPEVPIKVIEPNSLNQIEKQNHLQEQIQQNVIQEQVSLLQQLNELEQQLTTSQQTISHLNNSQQQLTLKNKNLLLQIQDLHVKYDHIINNYTFIPKH
ncbi:hypothetical protein HWV00_06250 [Moritella sp. 24]|uniref:type IV pilus assembly protein FimV n=1 Tax=Moritella sp. 24 TaxID=2746230 RepID=UPI001BA98ED3|nr:hypothetical protein [Moritella sp. 24]QUM75858.1 hypothetical protein HWV00_06250 [Moritella sp. 24]